MSLTMNLTMSPTMSPTTSHAMSPGAPQPGESATALVVPDAELTSALASLIGKTLDERPDVSDVHLAVGESARMRSCGRLSILREAPVDAPELSTFIALISLATVRAGMASSLLAHEGGARDFSATLGAHRLRGNLHLRAGGSLGLSLRRLRSTVPELDSLGLPGQIRRLIDRARGLLLVTGPTGSGKSTTLAALVRHLICARPIHVLTIEDPIEYRFMPGALVTPGAPDAAGAPAVSGAFGASGASVASDSGRAVIGCVTSREIGTDTPDFASAVRAAMRQDPDVIVIGEIRDRDTMHAALAAAETGHLVLATLHTPNASETIERVLSFFPPDQTAWARSVFANALIAVLSQALLGRRRGADRLEDRTHDRIDDRLEDRIEDRSANRLADRSADRIEDRIEARPAERKAAPGLTLVCELMVNTPAVRQQIVQGTTGQLRAIIAQGRRDGHVQMAAQLAERVRLGEIDEADARRVAHPPEEFEYLMQASMAAAATTPSQGSVRTSAQMSVHWSAQNAAQTAAQTSGRGRTK